MNWTKFHLDHVCYCLL